MKEIELSNYTYEDIKEKLNPKNITTDNNEEITSLAECFCSIMKEYIEETKKAIKGRKGKTPYAITLDKIDKYLSALRAYDPYYPSTINDGRKNALFSTYKSLFNIYDDENNKVKKPNIFLDEKNLKRAYSSFLRDLKEAFEKTEKTSDFTSSDDELDVAEDNLSQQSDIENEEKREMVNAAKSNPENYLSTNEELLYDAQVNDSIEETSEYISDEDYGIPSEEEEMERRLGK